MQSNLVVASKSMDLVKNIKPNLELMDLNDQSETKNSSHIENQKKRNRDFDAGTAYIF